MTTLKETTIPRRDRKLCPTVDCGEGLTEQAHKDTCDINQILKDYSKTGFLRHAQKNAGQYDDVSAVDFQNAMETVANVKSLFEGLPGQVRKEFNNQPGQFLEYVQNPSNHQSLAERGILVGNDGIDITGAYTTAPRKPSDMSTQDSPEAAATPPATEGEQKTTS